MNNSRPLFHYCYRNTGLSHFLTLTVMILCYDYTYSHTVRTPKRSQVTTIAIHTRCYYDRCRSAASRGRRLPTMTTRGRISPPSHLSVLPFVTVRGYSASVGLLVPPSLEFECANLWGAEQVWVHSFVFHRNYL